MEGGSWRRAGRQQRRSRPRARREAPPPAAAQDWPARARAGRLRDVHDQLDAAVGGAADRRFVALDGSRFGIAHRAQAAGGHAVAHQLAQHAGGAAAGQLPVRGELAGLDRHRIAVALDRDLVLVLVQDRRQPLDHVQSGGAERGLARGEQQLVADAKAHRLLVDDHVHRFAQVGQSQRFLGRGLQRRGGLGHDLAVARRGRRGRLGRGLGRGHSGGMATLSNSEYSPS